MASSTRMSSSPSDSKVPSQATIPRSGPSRQNVNPNTKRAEPFPPDPQASRAEGALRAARSTSDGQDLFFLGFEQVFDPLDLRIGQLLHLLIRPLLIIGRDQLVLRRLLDLVVPVPPNIPDRRLVVF